MRTRALSGAVLTLALLIADLPKASAQQASSFNELQLFSKPGDAIFVKNNDGTFTKVKVIGLTPSNLKVESNGTIRDLAEHEVVEIQQRVNDRLWNGMVIGAAVVGGWATAGGVISCRISYSPCGSEMAAAVGLYALAGVGIGAGVDGLIHKKRVVFRSAVTEAKTAAQSEPGQAFRDLQPMVRFRDKLQVIDKSGLKTQGTIVGFSKTGISLKSGADTRVWTEPDVVEIRRQYRDSAWDGTLYGTASCAFAAAMIAKLICGDHHQCDYTRIGVVGGLVGAASGAIADYSIKRFETVFKVPAGSTPGSFKLKVSPIVSSDRKGAVLSIQF